MSQSFFIYKNKEFKFDLALFQKHTKCQLDLIKKGQENGFNYFNLISEYECCPELSENCIHTFLSFFHDQEIKLTNSNIIQISFLSQKYDIKLFIDKTQNYVIKNKYDIINEFLSNDTTKINNEIEDLLSIYITNYLYNDLLLNIPISSMYRILIKYKNHNNFQETNDDQEFPIIKFLIKYIEQKGPAASFLLKIFKLGYKSCEYLNEKLCENFDLFDFNSIKQTIFQTLYQMNKKMKEKEYEIRQEFLNEQKASIESIRSNCVNIFNELLSIEPIKQFILKDEDNSNTNISSTLIQFGMQYTIRTIFNNSFVPIEPIQKDLLLLETQNVSTQSKFSILNLLIKENLFSKNSSYLMGNKNYCEIISHVSLIKSKITKKSIVDLFKIIENKPSVIEFVCLVFPYSKFKNTELHLITYWIPLICILISCNIYFSLIIDKNKFEFNKSSSLIDCKIFLIMNEKNNFSLSVGSLISSASNESPFLLDIDNEKVVFHMLYELSKNQMKTVIPMKHDEIFHFLYEKAKRISEKNNDQNPLLNRFLSIKDLFEINENSTISLIWNLIFTLSEYEILEISSLINPIESQILITALKLFKSNSEQNLKEILEFSKWAKRYDQYSTIIAGCVYNINKSYDSFNTKDISSLIKNVEDAIVYLMTVPEKTNKYWLQIIEKCKYEKKSLENANKKKEEILEKAGDLHKKLDKIDFTDTKYTELIKHIVLNLLIMQDFNEKELLNLQKIYDQLIACTFLDNEKNIKESICWPLLEFESLSETKTKNIDIFDSLLFYSKVKSILNEMHNTNNAISILVKLNEFREMDVTINLILSSLIHTEEKELIFNDDIIRYVRLSMDAILILKLYKIDIMILADPEFLCDFINDLEKRNPCNDADIQWINKIIKELPQNFLISIPEFDPNSLVFLILNKISTNYIPGPLLKDLINYDTSLIDNLSILMHIKFNSFKDAAKTIGQIFYNSLISQEEIPPQDYDELKSIFNEPLQISENDMKIINQLKIIFSIVDLLENWTNPSLSFNDTFFLSIDWKELFVNETLLNDYPSLLFWICQNKKCAKQIKKNYHNFVPNKKEIPIWLVYFRIISSKQCIKFSTCANTNISKIINETITNCIIKYIGECNNQKKRISYNWLNIISSYVPINIKNIKIQILRDFLYHLSFDDHDNKFSRIYELKYYYITQSVSEIFSLTLSNSQEVFQHNFFDRSSIAHFLCFPSKHIQNKIDKVFSEYEKETFFKYNYDLIDIGKMKKNPIVPLSYKDQIDFKILASPLFYISLENKIKCTINKLQLQIGPLYPSLLSNKPISINISSLIDEKIDLSIDCPQYSQILTTSNKVKNKIPIQIFIMPPKITDKKKKIINMIGNLKLNVKGYDEYIFPFDITLALFPIKVVIKCVQFPLSEIENNYFRLCCDQINSEERIDLEINNYYNHNFFVLNYELVPHDGNTANEPVVYLNEKTKSLSLYMPHVKKNPTRCKFDIIIKLSQNLEVKIHCDFVVLPLIFKFEMFDFCKKTFSKNVCHLILIKPDYFQFLHFRILCPYPLHHKAKIVFNMPKFVKIEESSLKIIKDDSDISFSDFEIENDFYFNLKISNSAPPFEYSLYSISLEIAGIKKEIILSLINSYDNIFSPNEFPCYSYIYNDDKWEKIKSNEDIKKMINNDSFYLITTPFSWYPNKDKFIMIHYNHEKNNIISISNPNKLQIKYIQISQENLIKVSQSEINIEKKYEKFYFIYSKEKITHYYSIVGYIEENPDEWFPTFDIFPDIGTNDIIQYFINKENMDKALSIKDNLLKFYNNSTPGDLFVHFMYEKNNILNINSIIEMFPKFIQSKFEMILIEIKLFINLGDKIPSEIQLIISNNLIITFLLMFKQKYNEIKSNNFCLQMPIHNSLIQKQIDKAFDELMKFDESMKFELSNKIKEKFDIVRHSINQIKISSLPEKSKQFEYMLISENNSSKQFNKEVNKQLKFDDCYNEKSVFEKTYETISSLALIDIPSDHSLSSYMEFISSCSISAVLLPAFIFNSLYKNNDHSTFERTFAILFTFYKEVTKESHENKSVLSYFINKFIELFEICMDKLKLAGINVDDAGISEELNKSTYKCLELISIPKVDLPNLPKIEWKE